MLKEYIEQYKKLYELKPRYGASSVKLLNYILPVIKEYKPISVLDYGCGRSPLIDMIAEQVPIKPFRYDPVFEEFSSLPNEKMDFLICTDVLQHVPLNDLHNVLTEISSISSNCYFHIKCTDHPTNFPNGKPTNCTVYPKEWWKEKLSEYFSSAEYTECNDETSVSFKTK